jgi:hypothetical protein
MAEVWSAAAREINRFGIDDGTIRRMASREVSAARRRIANILAVLILAVLGVSVWQTWDSWRERFSGDDRRGHRDGRRFGPGPGMYGRPPQQAADGEGLDWETGDRVRAALEITNAAEWQALEPKVVRIVRLQRQLPETRDLLNPDPPRPTRAKSDAAAAEETAELRVERASVRVQLKQAQDDLRKTVTRRQEAALVLLGLLE